VPAEQICEAPQAMPHAPQLSRSVVRSRHTPEQFISLTAHETTHIEPEHTCPAPQAMPHAPQFARSLVRSRHTPAQFVRPPPQLV
jgi:hypothetical protein